MNITKMIGVGLGLVCGVLSLLKVVPESEYVHGMLVAIWLVSIGNKSEEE